MRQYAAVKKFICFSSLLSLEFLHYYIAVPVDYVTPLQDVDVKEGETAVLTCEINKTDVTAVWSKEGEDITPDDQKYTISVDNYTHSLTIADCDIEDDAEYTITINEHTSVGNVFVEGKSCFIIRM